MEAAEEHNDIVVMSRVVTDKLDYSFSGPMDGIIAIGQVHVDLPTLHQRRRRSLCDRKRRNSLKLYRAVFDWYDIGIDYVEHAGHLHVIDVWTSRDEVRSTCNPDCVFEYPADDSKYIVECSPHEEVPL